MTTPAAPDFRQHFGANLERIRKSRGIPMREMGERLGIPFSSVSAYERGEVTPDVRTLLKIASALNVTPAALFQAPEPRPWLDLAEIAGAWWEGFHSAVDADAEYPAGRASQAAMDRAGATAAALEVLDQVIEVIAPHESSADRIGWIREIRESLNG